jgi:peptidoglycan/LPS O-acetylase OafA/YrhL
MQVILTPVSALDSLGQAHKKRIVGLDSIRAICALWVVFGHLGAPPLTAGLDESNIFSKLIGAIYGNFWSGPAAVIVFFVISGFCIHYPFSASLRIPSLSSYYLRRYLRIGIPLVVAVALSRMLSVDYSLFSDSILWSLIAELVYYTIYPLLLVVRRSVRSWLIFIVVSMMLAFVLAATRPLAGNYPSFGNALNWLLGLPVWLAGCWLADRVSRDQLPSVPSPKLIWLWRGLVLLSAMACSVLRFHSPLGYPWTLNIFGIFASLWLSREIVWYMASPPRKFLELIGVWSYSIYLVHVLAASLYKKIPMPNMGFILNWFSLMIFVFVSSFLFYKVVEWPSHHLARSLTRVFSGSNSQ